MLQKAVSRVAGVICRIGSLETASRSRQGLFQVICRIGSLEKFTEIQIQYSLVICRIGSLEIFQRCT